MDFIGLVKKVFGLRKQDVKPELSCFAGDGLVLVTDGKLIVFRSDERITGGINQVDLPERLNEIGEFGVEERCFLDPDGEPMEGLRLVGGDREVRIISTLESVIGPAMIKEGKEIPDKLKTAILSGREFELKLNDLNHSCADLISSNAKNPQKLDIDLGPGFIDVVAHGICVSLKSFKKSDPPPSLSYLEDLRAVRMFFEEDSLGVIVSFSYKTKEEEPDAPEKEGNEDMTKEETKDVANIVSEAAAIAQPKAPPPLGAQTGDMHMPIPQPPKAEGDPIPAVNAATKDAAIKKQNREAQAAEKAPPPAPPKAAPPVENKGGAEEPKPAAGLPKEEDIKLPEANKPGTESGETGTKPAEEPGTESEKTSDEERLEDMMVSFNENLISDLRGDITFLERLVKLQAKIIKKGSQCKKIRDENIKLKKENAELKKANDKFVKAQEAMKAALG